MAHPLHAGKTWRFNTAQLACIRSYLTMTKSYLQVSCSADPRQSPQTSSSETTYTRPPPSQRTFQPPILLHGFTRPIHTKNPKASNNESDPPLPAIGDTKAQLAFQTMPSQTTTILSRFPPGPRRHTPLVNPTTPPRPNS